MGRSYFVNEGNKIGYMPTEFGESGNSIIEKKIIAAADVLKGHVVAVTAPFAVSHTTGTDDVVLGVAMFDTKKDEPVSVETEGLFKLVASAAITAPARITAAAGGKVKAAGENDVACGIAISSTTAADQEVFVKFSI